MTRWILSVSLCAVGLKSRGDGHGGFENIHSRKREGEDAKTFSFEIECDLLEQKEVDYSLSINNLDSEPGIRGMSW